MKEKTLLKIALITALVGIILLGIISPEREEGQGEGKGEMGEEKVKIQGVVGKAVEREKVIFLEILNEKVEKTKVVLFKEGDEVKIQEGDYVEISGTKEEYEGEEEVIGSKVVKK